MKKTVLPILLAFAPFVFSAQTASLDSVFGTNGKVITGLYGLSGNPYGTDFAALPNGNIILGGHQAGYVGLEKYNQMGVLDTFFSKTYLESEGLEVGVCVQKDGKTLLVSENATDLNAFVIRVDTSGNLDTGFGNEGVLQTGISHFFVHNVFEQSDGKIVVFGDEWGQNASRFSVLRWLPDGTPDTAFAQHGALVIDLPEYTHEIPVAMLEQPDHKLLFAGTIGFPDWHTLLVRIHPDGTPDATFGNNGLVIDAIQANSDAYGLALQSDGKILISGDAGPAFEAIAARYNSDGVRDTSFGNQGVAYFPEAFEGIGVAQRPDGKILTVNWSKHSTLGGIVLGQLMPDGQRDLSFGDNGVFRMIEPGMRPRALSVVGDKVIVSARKLNGTTLKRLYRFLLDLYVGTIDSATQQTDPNLWVYPNPIAESFTLRFDLVQKEQVSVGLFDMSGKKVQNFVQNQSFEPGAQTLNLMLPPSLPAGNYVLTLESNNRKLTSIQLLKA